MIRKSRPHIGILLIAILSFAGGLFSLTPASASTTSGDIFANFNGATIDLAQGWQGAHACLIESLTNVQCFSTSAEMNSYVASDAALAVSPDDSCSGGTLYLFQDINFGGNELGIISPVGIWIDIADAGFGNETSSWINDATCSALAAKTTNGSGSEYVMQAQTANEWIGSAWNDVINSIQLG